MSYNMVDTEMKQLVSIGNALPMMFLAISVFMLYVVLKKVIDRDQSVIGTMKAMGMGDGELISIYMVQGVLVGMAGAIIGSVAAIPFGKYMFSIYVEIFNLPVSTYHSYPDSRLKGLILSVAVSVLAVYLGIRGILEITPAQAMRAKAPKAAASLKIPGIILKRLGTMERLGCRSIARNPFRGCLIVLAIGFPFATASVMYSFGQVAEQVLFSQFDKIQTYDMQISLAKNTSPIKAANTGNAIRGVTDSEGVAQLIIEIINQNRSEFSVLYCLNRNSDLWKIMDLHGTYYEPPDDGLLINSRIAEKLRLQKGDQVEINCTGLTPEPIKLTIIGIIDESLGGGNYISKEGLIQYFNTTGIADTILLKVKPGQEEEVRSRLLAANEITWLVDTARIMKGYREQMQNALIMMDMFALMAAAAGGILIYNISLINIRERIVEFGTIVLMGGTHRELGKILIFEQTIYFILGIMLGVPSSFGIRTLIEQIVMSDEYTIKMVVEPDSYFKALVICFAITAVTFLAQMRVLGKIKIADVLKGRE